jgi:rare lipoprotein A
MKAILTWAVLFCAVIGVVGGTVPQDQKGLASWYGESHRGRLMANGKPFNPDKLTAASWFYPLGTRVLVTVSDEQMQCKNVLVTITDRGPAWELVREGRVIDLARAAFKKLAPTDLGLIQVRVQLAN